MCLSFLKVIYLFDKSTSRGEQQAKGEEKKRTPLLSREHNAGLEPRTLGS